MQRPVLQFVIFVLVFAAVVGGMHFYLWHRLVRAPELGAGWQRAGTWAFVALFVSVPLGLFVVNAAPRSIGSVVAAFVYGWFGLVIILFFLLVPMEGLRLGARAVSSLTDHPLDEGRRAFLARLLAGAAGVLGVGMSAVGLASALGEVAVQPVRVRLRKLPGALSGFRIVQLTDIHIGPTIGRGWLEGVVAKVNALDPDLVAITGDLVDGSVEDLREHVAPLKELRAKHGVFFVTGNHEYYSGADAWIAKWRELGVRVLRNERVSIERDGAAFDLAGVDDHGAHKYPGHGMDVAKAVAGRDPSRALVLLAHQPRQVHVAAKHGVDLQLSGHTHGGQVWPWHYIVSLQQGGLLAGRYQIGDTQLYVSRGAGYWGPPVRVGAPPEITRVRLLSGA